jgi:hypothetical protein
MISVDTPTLTELITNCFKLSMDGALTDEQRNEFLVAGKRLRGSLLNLLSAQFNDATQEVLDANSELDETNEQVVLVTDHLASVDNTLARINSLVTVLDDLLKIAASFH